MNTDDAKRGVEAARAKASELGMRGFTITILDTAGVPYLVERSNNGPGLPVIISDAKAATSAMTGAPTSGMKATEERWPGLTAPIAARLGGRFSLYAGGVPIKVNDQLVGAIGVSGGTPEQDEEVANAAAAAIAG
jgi:uncharacterized protein GlcG (DUF336 family)